MNWLQSLSRGTTDGAGARGYQPLISEYIYYLMAKLAFHRQHPEFNGMTKTCNCWNRPLTTGRNIRVRRIHQLEVHQRPQRGIRDNLRPYDVAGSDRRFPETHLLTLPKWCQQRMQDSSVGSTGPGELWYLQVHHQHAACNAYQ